MNKEMYFVIWTLHNGTNDGWAYKVENKYAKLSDALKKYHELLASYIGGTTYDLVNVLIKDGYGNVIESEFWEASQEPNE